MLLISDKYSSEKPKEREALIPLKELIFHLEYENDFLGEKSISFPQNLLKTVWEWESRMNRNRNWLTSSGLLEIYASASMKQS